jgi:hypothetical protein
LGFVVEPDELMSEDSAALFFECFFEAFLAAFFEWCFECFMVVPFASFFVVVVVDEVSLEPVEPVEPVWAKAPNDTSAKAESTAAIVRIMLISFTFLPDRCRDRQ